MLSQTVATKDNLTRINGKVKHTGLTRKGFAKSSQTQFQFDRETIAEYYDIIVEEVNKGMWKVRQFYPEMRSDSASYDSISTTIVDHILSRDYTYSSGQFHSDSRGRNISGMLDKVFNPIGFKVARACESLPQRWYVRDVFSNQSKCSGQPCGRAVQGIGYIPRCYLPHCIYKATCRV
jgi:hypothetical protein